MFNIDHIVEAIEGKTTDKRWNGAGKGSLAVLLGFQRPANSDESGTWSHPTAGDFPDHHIPFVINKVFEGYVRSCNHHDMLLTTGRISNMLKPLVTQLQEDRDADTEGPAQAWDTVDEILDLLNQALTKCQVLSFETEN